MIRRIRDLLYDQGFTISGARNKMQEILQHERDKSRNGEVLLDGVEVIEVSNSQFGDFEDTVLVQEEVPVLDAWQHVRRELGEIRELLSEDF